MNKFEYNYEMLTGENNLNLFAALSIFTTNAPKLIDGIIKASKEENLAKIEELAAKLISCSSPAQMSSFTDTAKNLIIAVREHNKSTIDKIVDSLMQNFEQMVRDINPVALEQKMEFDNSSASFRS
jgi:hypothetical protein